MHACLPPLPHVYPARDLRVDSAWSGVAWSIRIGASKSWLPLRESGAR